MTQNFELEISATVAPCYSYLEQGNRPQKITVVIVPIRIDRDGDDLVIHWSCSRGTTCYQKCYYAKAGENF